MAACSGFAMLLVLTLVALITFSQPLFQSEAVVIEQTQSDLELAPNGHVIARELVQQNLKTFEAGSSQQHKTRKLIQRDSPETEQESSTSRRSVLTTFQSDRMVPTGPNPLHNSNRSQVIFP